MVQVSDTYSIFSSKLSTIPEGYANLFKHSGFMAMADKSIMNTLPYGFSIEVWPNGPESVKYKQKLFWLKISEFGPIRGMPS